MYNYDSTDLRSVTVTAVTADGVETTYTYDANGNTLTAGDKTYTYNDRGQQTGYSNGTTAAAYAYNPSGLRKAKTVGGSTKYFVYNGMNIVYEYSESVADGVTYFYGLNRTHNSNGEIYVYNAHGDVVQLVKDNSVVASYTYDAFGNRPRRLGRATTRSSIAASTTTRKRRPTICAHGTIPPQTVGSPSRTHGRS